MNMRKLTAAATGLATMTLVAACGGGGNSGSSISDTTARSAGAGVTVAVAKDAALAAKLPAQYKSGISVASDIPFAPMEMFDASQNVTGFDYDLSQAIGQKLGVPMKFEKQAWDSIIPSLQSGKHDIIMSGMNDTLERQKTLDFVDYFHGGMAIVVAKGNPEKITTLLDLCGKTVAVEKATVQGDLLRSKAKDCAAENKQPIKVTELPTENDAQTAVRAGKASADVVDAAVGEYNAKTAGNGTLFEVVHDAANPSGYSPVYTGIGILKKDKALAPVLQEAITDLIKDGTYGKILAKYNLSAYAVTEATINHGS